MFNFLKKQRNSKESYKKLSQKEVSKINIKNYILELDDETFLSLDNNIDKFELIASGGVNGLHITEITGHEISLAKGIFADNDIIPFKFGYFAFFPSEILDNIENIMNYESVVDYSKKIKTFKNEFGKIGSFRFFKKSKKYSSKVDGLRKSYACKKNSYYNSSDIFVITVISSDEFFNKQSKPKIINIYTTK